MQKRIVFIGLMAVLFFFGFGGKVYATTIETSSIEEIAEDIVSSQLDLLNWNGIEDVENRLKSENENLKQFNLKEKVFALVTGDEQFSLEYIMSSIAEMFFQEIGTYLRLMMQFLLIAIACGILQALTSSFVSKDITKIAFLAAYLLIILLSVQSLFMLVQLAQTTIDRLTDIMAVTIPTLLAFMAISGYISSASALAPIIISCMNVIAFLLKAFVLPSIVAVIVLQIVSTISEDFQVEKLVSIFYKGAKWLLRGVLVVGIGIMGIYRIKLTLVDEDTYRGVSKLAARFIPIIGDATGGIIEYVTKCFMLVKSSFSIGVIIWIILLVALPIIKIGACSGLYHLLSAVIEPLGDKRMSKIAGHLGNGCGFVVGCVMLVATLCISVLVVCISVGSNIL